MTKDKRGGTGEKTLAAEYAAKFNTLASQYDAQREALDQEFHKELDSQIEVSTANFEQDDSVGSQ